MPNLADHQSSKFTKLLVIGDSGTGKTGALSSLVKAGFKLRIWDYDNGLDSLVQVCRHIGADLSLVEFESLRDKYKSTDMGPILDGVPKGFTRGVKLFDKWSDGSVPSTWGPDTILVLDTLTFFADAAFNWARGMNPAAKEPRQWYFSAQKAVEDCLALLAGPDFQTNVIVNSHIRYQERQDGAVKGYPTAVGSALGPTIPTYFNAMALVQSVGTGTNVKRTIQTAPTALIDLKNPAPFKMAPTLPLETGLADYFRTVREA
jgi:hypothetical protein